MVGRTLGHYQILDQQRRLRSVEVRSSPGFGALPPKLLFPTQVIGIVGLHTYAVTPDGQRFLINTIGGGEIRSTPLTVVLTGRRG
jgi:hypothetical protein